MILTKMWTDKLINMPETGMGYQVATVTLKNGTVYSNITIYNAEYLVGVGFASKDIADIQVN